MASRSAKEIVEDRKIDWLLEDMESELGEALALSDKLFRSASLRHAAQGKRNLSDASAQCDRAFIAYEKEYVLCAKGKSTDIAKLRKLVSALLDALDDLHDMNGRILVLEKADVDAKLFSFLSVLGQIVGYGGEFNKLIRDMESLHGKLEKAIKAVRDVKTKAMVAGAIAAIGICLTPLGATAAVIVTISAFAVGQALDSALDGNVDSDVKKTWDKVSKLGDAADLIGDMPKAFGPVMVLLSSGVDLAECFANEREKDAVLKEIKDLKGRIEKLGPPYAKMYRDMLKKGNETMSNLTKAARDADSFKPVKSKSQTLPSLLK
ncbi:MAG: hypothetical protein ACK4RN_07575 [Pseudorhodobacter sp.]